MTTLMRRFNDEGLEPFDILFKNLFDTNTFFSPLVDSKPKYPIDIYEDESGLQFDVAIIGLSENDVKIEVTDGDTLNISYQKENNEDSIYEPAYIHQGIAKRSFSFSWKISNKFDLEKIVANVDKGLLNIVIPHSEEAKPRIIEIKPKKVLKAKQ
jgi:HSP20 family molecular chaperone IbpA